MLYPCSDDKPDNSQLATLHRLPHGGDKSDCCVSYVPGFGVSTNSSRPVLGCTAELFPAGSNSWLAIPWIYWFHLQIKLVCHMQISSEKSCPFALVNHDWQHFGALNMVWSLMLTLLVTMPPWAGASHLNLCSFISRIKQEVKRIASLLRF